MRYVPYRTYGIAVYKLHFHTFFPLLLVVSPDFVVVVAIALAPANAVVVVVDIAYVVDGGVVM